MKIDLLVRLLKLLQRGLEKKLNHVKNDADSSSVCSYVL